jgi:hypothetical protein
MYGTRRKEEAQDTNFGFLLVHAGCRFAGRITNALTYKQIFVTLEQE